MTHERAASDAVADDATRVDHLVIAELVAPGVRVLDVGCGDGELLALLEATRGVDGRGIEISQKGVNECVARGLSVIQGDADTDLVDYPDDAFDYVILSQTLQATRRPRDVLEQMLRIGDKAIVSFPNFGHWRMRGMLLVNGRMPVTRNLPAGLVRHARTSISARSATSSTSATRSAPISRRASRSNGSGQRIALNAPWWFWNLFGQQAVFLLSH